MYVQISIESQNNSIIYYIEIPYMYRINPYNIFYLYIRVSVGFNKNNYNIL